MKKSVLILTTILAPYRVELFVLISKEINLTVCYEQASDKTRSSEWFLDKKDAFKSVFLKGWNLPSFIPRLSFFNEIVNNNPELVVFYEFSTLTAQLAILYCIINRIKYSINCDGAFIENKRSCKDWFKKYSIKHSSLNLANGESARKYFLHYGAKDSTIEPIYFTSLFKKDIIEKPISSEEKLSLKLRLGFKDKPLFIIVGRFIGLKRVEDVLNIWQEYDKWAQLAVIGNGILKDTYLHLINQNKYNNVRIVEHMSKLALKEYYCAANALIFPSSKDVWGLVVNEALAVGLPVITSDKANAGAELVKNHFNGFVYQCSNYEALKESMTCVNMCAVNSTEMAQNCINSIKLYTYENNSEAHVQAFLGVMK